MQLLESRWLQLVLGIVCMAMIANLQYGWTLFVLPIDQAHKWGSAAIQVAFTVFVLTETWLVPFEGWLTDRFGPRPIVLSAGVLVGASWLLDGYADQLWQLYVAAALGGIGSGMVYGTVVGNALKWFNERRGLAAGLTAAGFGAGSALTIVPIASWIGAHGYQSAFIFFGAIQGIVVVLVSLLLRRPPSAALVPSAAGSADARPSAEARTALDRSPGQVLRAPVFYLLYLLFMLVAAGGLMATAQLAQIARDYGVAGVPVSLVGITLPALTFALSLDRVMNGITRPFFGWLSDRIGREVTMLIAFGIEGFGILALVAFANDPMSFVVLSGLVFFAFGEIYSLFPAICGDTFGQRFATTNYGLLYTAKGTAGLLVPLSSVIHAATGSWTAIFYVAAAANLLAAILAILVLGPMRSRYVARITAAAREGDYATAAPFAQGLPLNRSVL